MRGPLEAGYIPPAQPGARGVLAGGCVDRRTVLRGVLRASAGLGLGLGLPAALAGCGIYIRQVAGPPLYEISLGTETEDSYIQFPGFESLIADRARALAVTAAFFTFGILSTEQAMDLRLAASNTEDFFNPANDKTPLTIPVFVVSAIDPVSLAPVVEVGLKNGAQIVSFLEPLEHQSAQITIDPGQLGSLLATDAAAWARSNLHGRATALFVAPSTVSQANFLANPANPQAEQQAIRSTLARLSPSLTFTAPTTAAPQLASDVVRAVRSSRSVRVVLCAYDADAVAIAQMLRRAKPANPRDVVYVGALGAPTPSPAALTELQLDQALRAIAAVRPRDLAYSLVDLPSALLRGRRPYDVVVPPELLTPRSPALAATKLDYDHPQNPASELATSNAAGGHGFYLGALPTPPKYIQHT